MNKDTFELRIDERLEARRAPFAMEMLCRAKRAMFRPPFSDQPLWRRSILEEGPYYFIRGGQEMERVDEVLKQTTEELGSTKKALQDTINELTVMRTAIQDTLHKEIVNIRESRMAMVRESADLLTALKDVRKFFLDSNYEEEMKRLQAFTQVTKELKALLDNGTLDALADTMLRLAQGPKS